MTTPRLPFPVSEALVDRLTDEVAASQNGCDVCTACVRTLVEDGVAAYLAEHGPAMDRATLEKAAQEVEAYRERLRAASPDDRPGEIAALKTAATFVRALTGEDQP